MESPEEDLAAVAESFHEEVPTTFKVSLTMSKHTRDLLATVREEANDRAGQAVLDTNDVIRLALVGATRYQDPEGVSDAESERLAPLFEELARTVRADENLRADRSWPESTERPD
jgi:hypothetical protein